MFSLFINYPFSCESSGTRSGILCGMPENIPENPEGSHGLLCTTILPTYGWIVNEPVLCDVFIVPSILIKNIHIKNNRIISFLRQDLLEHGFHMHFIIK